jgi:hypothetical protein
MIRGHLRLMGSLLLCPILPGISALAASGTQHATPPQPRCDVGPMTIELGGNDWLVYACDDRASMAVAPRRDGAGPPISFYLRPRAGTWEVQFVGEGENQEDAAARAELLSFSAVYFEQILSDILERDFQASFGWPPIS